MKIHRSWWWWIMMGLERPGWRYALSGVSGRCSGYAGVGGGKGFERSCEVWESLAHEQPFPKLSRASSPAVDFRWDLLKRFATACKYLRSHIKVVSPAPSIITG